MTKRQHIFVKEYLVDSNATRAAIAAGYSKPAASAIGSRLLRNAKVRQEIEEQTSSACLGGDVVQHHCAGASMRWNIAHEQGRKSVYTAHGRAALYARAL